MRPRRRDQVAARQNSSNLASRCGDPKTRASNMNASNQIWSVDDKNDRSNVTTERLADLNKELTDAQSESLKKQALYEFAKSGDLDAVPQLRDNSVLQDLQKKQADLSIQYTDAVNQYGPNFPKVLRLQAQMKESGFADDARAQRDHCSAQERISRSQTTRRPLGQRLDQQKPKSMQCRRR